MSMEVITTLSRWALIKRAIVDGGMTVRLETDVLRPADVGWTLAEPTREKPGDLTFRLIVNPE